jgi:hypothetical protein
MDKDVIFIQTDHIIKEISKIIKPKVLVNSKMKYLVILIKDNGKRICLMEMESKFGKMARNMMDK